MKNCLYCLCEFNPKTKLQLYCGKKCAGIANLNNLRQQKKFKKRTGKYLDCAICKKQFYAPLNRLNKYKVRFCSKVCAGTDRLNQLWADPNFLLNKAANLKLPYHKYVYINIDGKQIREHRYIMEQFLGRKLLKNEHVHHIDGNGLNNDINNLELLTNSEHQKKEWLFKKSLIFKP